MQEFVNSMTKLVLTHEDNRRRFVYLICIVTFPDLSSEWLQLSLAYSTIEMFSWILNEYWVLLPKLQGKALSDTREVEWSKYHALYTIFPIRSALPIQLVKHPYPPGIYTETACIQYLETLGEVSERYNEFAGCLFKCTFCSEGASRWLLRQVGCILVLFPKNVRKATGDTR